MKRIFPAVMLAVFVGLAFTTFDVSLEVGDDWPVYGGIKQETAILPLIK